ncbi:DEAD/DEAH box helicase [Mycolicibacter sinensis]|uniref:DEAD/DEAH box helicase n=1 Tax=Mycolicibacter sinensis (strain JDM601) TaxID=875328 RepID=A0A1A2NX89_MYCSD|nr:DEAD/DEAH box helicase [Mycolicibacter sinensis]OBH19694.1 DEAD/DEAH box helicase [Mycolicibacter sinensis]OBI25922.1 DEAD/DEAH box helicase [Mycolicibacter sinensis]
MTKALDALAVGRQIEETYKRYLKTLLSPRDPDLARAFDAEVDGSQLLTKGPLLELTPPYARKSSINQLIGEGLLHPGLRRINFPEDQPLYVHQETAIRKVLTGRNLVVSTGTGSGKTESFLLPILNSLVAEEAAGTLRPGVRALLLYPMNALANDQLKRLREVLKSTPEITFGRYTGETKRTEGDALAEFNAVNRGKQRLPNELISRDEMRRTPPHILLTNYAMLEYLLLRPEDIDLFSGAHAGTWRFLVLDEAHVYDGAQGSEVAMLLRRLRQRVAGGKALQCIATSASLTGTSSANAPAEAMKFARDLFDAPFEHVDSEPGRQDLVTATREPRRSRPTWSLTGEQLLRLGTGDESELAALAGVDDPAEALHAETLTADLKAALAGGPRAVRDLESRLWPEDPQSAEKLAALVALGSRVQDSAGNPVLSARYHMFVRATEGAFVSFADNGPRIFLGRHEIDPDNRRAVFEFGTCQRCGAVHLAGDVEDDEGRQYFRPSTKTEGAVKWLVLVDGAGDTVIDEDEATLGDQRFAGDATLRSLCVGCGYLTKPGETACSGGSCPGGPMKLVREHPNTTSVMSKCTECGALARQVIRRLRTDTNAAPAVITTALYQELPEAEDESADHVGGGRKLLMFSDSRQAAAFAAPYLDRTYGRLLERRYLTQALQDPKYADEDLTVEDLAIVARKKARAAGHFREDIGKIAEEKTANEWVVGELLTMDARQSLEGLGLMRVALKRPRGESLPRGLTSLGLSEDEGWALLDELVKSARMQGAMTLLDEVDIKSERFEPRNVTVRIRSAGSDAAKKVLSWLPSGHSGTTNRRITFTKKVLAVAASSADPRKVLDGCWKFLCDKGYITVVPDKTSSDVYQVNHEKLLVRNGLDCTWYRCDVCRRTTAFSVRGVCPNNTCDGKLSERTIPDAASDTNHYRVIYQTMTTAPLSAREHTAQWSAREAATIQDEFIRGQVNVLSCSTTFELGVDVGELQSVVMRNMPPKTANYIQRAGRAGRRAASAALVLTYARRTSHDLAKYQQPESMINGQMRVPWVPIDNVRIARRHAHSVALAAFFRDAFESHGMQWKYAGEFFSPEDGQEAPASRVRAFLTPVPAEIKAALQQALPKPIADELGVADDAWVPKLCDLLDRVRDGVSSDIKELTEAIDKAAESKNGWLMERLKKTRATVERRQLLGFLANRNVLPKYGFPVDTVELRTVHCADRSGAKLELDRDLSLAIYEYAPGNEVVAGGKIFTSRGLHRIPGRELEEFQYRICKLCKRFQSARVLDAGDPCPGCGEKFGTVRKYVIPEFGFVADSQTHDVGTEPPARNWSGASYVVDVGDEIMTETLRAPSGIEVVARAGKRATMAVISDGGTGGFHVCDWCGWANVFERSKVKRKHERPTTGQECTGPLSVLSLGHQYQTDVAEFTFKDPRFLGISEESWLSTLYALLGGASEALEITRDDIDGALAWSKEGLRSIILFDTVPGGAGAAMKIAENVELVLKTALERVNTCDCGPETSCYGCLRSYRNGRYHDKLSRSGALQILESLGIDGLRSGMSDEWGVALDLAPDRLEALLAELATQGKPEPEVGVELGEHYWPIEAVWRREKVVVVDGRDDERDTSLGAEGFSVFQLGDVDSGTLAAVLGAVDSSLPLSHRNA